MACLQLLHLLAHGRVNFVVIEVQPRAFGIQAFIGVDQAGEIDDMLVQHLAGQKRRAGPAHGAKMPVIARKRGHESRIHHQPSYAVQRGRALQSLIKTFPGFEQTRGRLPFRFRIFQVGRDSRSVGNRFGVQAERTAPVAEPVELKRRGLRVRRARAVRILSVRHGIGHSSDVEEAVTFRRGLKQGHMGNMIIEIGNSHLTVIIQGHHQFGRQQERAGRGASRRPANRSRAPMPYAPFSGDASRLENIMLNDVQRLHQLMLVVDAFPVLRAYHGPLEQQRRIGPLGVGPLKQHVHILQAGGVRAFGHALQGSFQQGRAGSLAAGDVTQTVGQGPAHFHHIQARVQTQLAQAMQILTLESGKHVAAPREFRQPLFHRPTQRIFQHSRIARADIAPLLQNIRCFCSLRPSGGTALVRSLGLFPELKQYAAQPGIQLERAFLQRPRRRISQGRERGIQTGAA